MRVQGWLQGRRGREEGRIGTKGAAVRQINHITPLFTVGVFTNHDRVHLVCELELKDMGRNCLIPLV